MSQNEQIILLAKAIVNKIYDIPIYLHGSMPFFTDVAYARIGGGVIQWDISNSLQNFSLYGPLDLQSLVDGISRRPHMGSISKEICMGLYENVTKLGEFSPSDKNSSLILKSDMELLFSDLRAKQDWVLARRGPRI